MRDPYFPFHILGYRSNPFRALTDDEWTAIVVLSERVVQAAEQSGHLQVLGDLGRGKTSTLLGLAEYFRQGGQTVAYEYLPIGQAVFTTTLTGLDVFLLDEAQRLRPAERRRLLAAAARGPRLILGSHENLMPFFERVGLAISTVRLGSAERAPLASILARRLDYFALGNGLPAVTLDPSALPYLETAFGTNLRAMEHFLYEVFQRLAEPVALTAERLHAIAAANPETLQP